MMLPDMFSAKDPGDKIYFSSFFPLSFLLEAIKIIQLNMFTFFLGSQKSGLSLRNCPLILNAYLTFLSYLIHRASFFWEQAEHKL